MKRTIGLISFILFFSFIPLHSIKAGPVPDTGQTKCYNNTTEIPCPQPGEAFYGQDASYIINPPSYTKLDAEGNDLLDDATSWVMVRDNITGLIWEVKTDDGSIHDKDNTYTWYDSNPATNGGNAGTPGNGTDTEDFINTLNTANFGGFSDWRLPTIKELQSLTNYGRSNPAIDINYFPITMSSDYWSSTTDTGDIRKVFTIHFYYDIMSFYNKSYTFYARAVRGGRSSRIFINNGDKTITDTSTGLMWQQEEAAPMAWEPAITHCEGLTLAGYDDWRLPNIIELQYLMEYYKTDFAIDKTYFPDSVVNNFYWSSTPIDFVTVLTIYLGARRVLYNYTQDSYYVRAVRGGQNQVSGHLTILNPIQGSMWGIGSSMPFYWQTLDIPGNVKISISRDGGKTYNTISDSTENDGTYVWTVDGELSPNCMLKIEPLIDPSKATVQGLFSINDPPYSPTSPSPSHQASNIAENADLSWAGGDPNTGDAVTYDLYFGTTHSPPLVASDLTGLSYDPGILSFTTTYYWKVVAKDNRGAETSGPIWSFSTYADLDSDYMPDIWEVDNGLNPNINDAGLDKDGDKFTNGREYQDRTEPDDNTSHLILSQVNGSIPDTDQTTSYTETYGEDSDYIINPPSYIKMDSNGKYLYDNATSWDMVRDNVTGLTWEMKQNMDNVKNYSDPHDADNTYSWRDSNYSTASGDAGTNRDGTDTEDFINALNTANYGGHSDWRLPTVKELRSLVNYSIINPAIDTAYFTNTMSSGYWSSTSYLGSGSQAWSIFFNVGYIKEYDKSYYYYHVRAVRGSQSDLFNNLIINGDNTVTDISTGLMWQQDTAGPMAWEPAIIHCEEHTLAGYNDWRIPNIKELNTLVDYGKAYPNIDTSYFPDTILSSYYWASSTYMTTISNAWSMHYNNASFGSSDKSSTTSYYIKAVRGGQNRLSDHLFISSPAQAVRLIIGRGYTITWDTAGIAGNVRILLSRQGGKEGTFNEVLSNNTPNDGEFTWAATGLESFNCALRIEPINEPEKATTQSLFSICSLDDAWITAQKTGDPDSYYLTLYGRFTDGIVPLEADWSVSNPSIATITHNTLNALQNGRAEVNAAYEGITYATGVFVYTTFEAMEMEPNNTKEASYVNTYPMTNGTFYEGYLPTSDTDFFKFTLTSSSILDIGYLSYSITADTKIEIFDASNTLMATGTSTNGKPYVFPLGLPAGSYFIKLTSAGDIDQDNAYVVTYKILDTMPDKETINLDLGETGQGNLYHLEDEVTFSLSLEDARAVKLQFNPHGNYAKYLIEVLDNTQTVIDQIRCLDQMPVVIEAVLMAGDYSIRITPIDLIDAAHPFNLELTESTLQLEVEPNNTYQQSTGFDITAPIQSKLPDNTDQDFFEFELTTPRYLELTFACPGSSRNYNLKLYKESDQNLIDGIDSMGGADISLHMGLGVGRYYLKVTSSGTENAVNTPIYEITITDSAQTNLEIESNNTITVANAIEKAAPRKGRIYSSGDTDYYGFHLSELGIFNIAFSTGSTTGDYKLSLVDENDQVIDYRNSANGASFSFNANQPPGNFYIKIQPNGDIDQYQQYTLTLTSSKAIEGIKKIVSVVVTGSDSDMLINDTQTLSATAGYSDATSEAISSPVWSSMDDSIATVNSSGFVTAKAEGSTTIIATYGGLAGSFNITVGSPSQTFAQHYGNLIIVAGSGASESDPLNESAQYLSDHYYMRFNNRLFLNNDIYYFNPVSYHDLDEDGYDNNVVDDSTPTVTEFGQAITTWAASQSTDGPLFIYMVGHGETDTFSFPTGSLTANQLKGFIDTFQTSTGRRVVVIIEACKSGTFTNNLVTPGSNIIAVTSSDNNDSYLMMDGKISFSQFLMDGLRKGDTVYESWLDAKTRLSDMEAPFNLMNPQLVEGIASASNNTWVGGDFVVANLLPGWIVGTVYNNYTDTPVVGATVNISVNGTAAQWNKTTVADGYFLCEVPAGTYTITITANGYETLTLTNVGVGLAEIKTSNYRLAVLGDSDSDGVSNDNDAFPNNPNEWLDHDSDGTGDNADTDDDNDGMPDVWEDQYDLDPLFNDAADDFDEDGYSNLKEYQRGTDPMDKDSFPVKPEVYALAAVVVGVEK